MQTANATVLSPSKEADVIHSSGIKWHIHQIPLTAGEAALGAHLRQNWRKLAGRSRPHSSSTLPAGSSVVSDTSGAPPAVSVSASSVDT